MVIGIAGKIGSGKDTVASIIQYLTSDYYPNKSYERFLDKKNSDWGPPLTDWKIKKFAYKLKQIASLLTGISIEDFEKQEIKEIVLGKEWEYNEHIEDSFRPNDTRHIKMTVREMLQRIGTDAMRYGLHVNTWVNALFADYKPTEKSFEGLYGTISKNSLPNWIISDLRFPNEFDAIKERGGITIKVVRPNNPYPASNHVSETSLDNYFFDYEIVNNGNLKDLEEKVKNTLIIENILK